MGSLARLAREKRLPSARWQALRRVILERDGYRCRNCGRAGRLEVDHIRTLWRGGSNEPDNLQALCAFPCHRDKTSAEQTTILRRPDVKARFDGLVSALLDM